MHILEFHDGKNNLRSHEVTSPNSKDIKINVKLICSVNKNQQLINFALK